MQVPGLTVICLLLYLEEAGLPLPIAPGEAVLLGAGLLIASGAAPVWLVIPLAYGSVLAGVFTAFSLAGWMGPERLQSLARRLHAGRPYERASARLRSASPLQIAGSRLLPGLRVYTSLVAGAVGLNRTRFLSGVIPASAVWVLAFIGLGFFVGVPVEHLIGRLAAYSLRAAAVVVMALVWILAARRMPSASVQDPVPEAPAAWRLPLALFLDSIAVTSVVVVLSILSGLIRQDFDDVALAAAIFALLGLVYLIVARQTVGFTLGEALLEVRYHPPRRLPFAAR